MHKLAQPLESFVIYQKTWNCILFGPGEGGGPFLGSILQALSLSVCIYACTERFSWSIVMAKN